MVVNCGKMYAILKLDHTKEHLKCICCTETSNDDDTEEQEEKKNIYQVFEFTLIV